MEYNLSELKKSYDRELRLKFSNEKTRSHYTMALKKVLKSNSRCYRMSVIDLKEYFADFRQEYSDSYFNVLGSAIKLFYDKVLKQPLKMQWFVPVKTYPVFHDIITTEEFKSIIIIFAGKD